MTDLDGVGRELEDQRDHLLESLTDLEEEFEAGDIDDIDYQVLRADYTARAAAVLRQIDHRDAPLNVEIEPAVTGRGRTWVTALGVLAFAVLAGVLVAQLSGSRRGNDSITGDIRNSSRALLFEAQQAFGEGDIDDAISTYGDVIDQDPSNVEALTYQAWLISRSDQGRAEEAATQLEDAIALDPDYADARAFAAIVALDLGDGATAAEQLAAFEALDPPPFAQSLIDQAQVRERIAMINAEPIVAGEVTVADSGIPASELVLAAEALALVNRNSEALRLLLDVVTEYPDDPELISAYGWFLARASVGADGTDTEVATLGLNQLDRALDLDPTYRPALLYRAFTRNQLGDVEGARIDFEAFDANPDDEVEVLGVTEADVEGLRAVLQN